MNSMIIYITLFGLINSVQIVFGMNQEKRIILAQKLSNKSLKVNDYIIAIPSAYAALKKEVSMHNVALSHKLAAMTELGISLLNDFNNPDVRHGKRADWLRFVVSPKSIFNMMHKKDLTQGYALRSPRFSYTELFVHLDEQRLSRCSYAIEYSDHQSTLCPLSWQYNLLTNPQVHVIKIPEENNRGLFLMPNHIVYIELYYGDNQLSDWIRFECFEYK